MVRINFSISEKLDKQIDKLARSIGISKPEMKRYLLRIGLAKIKLNPNNL